MVSDPTAPWSDWCNTDIEFHLSSCILSSAHAQISRLPSRAVMLFQKTLGGEKKGTSLMKTRMMGIQNSFNKENYGKDATLEGPCLETSATAGWVALNDSRGFERAGSKEESDCYEGGLSSISSWTKGFPAVTCSDLQPMPAGVGPHHHPLSWGSEETVEFDELLQTTAWF